MDTGELVCTYCREAAATRASGATPCEVCGAPVGPLEGFPLPDGARWDACPACKRAYYTDAADMDRRRQKRWTDAFEAAPPPKPGKLPRQNPATCPHAPRVEPRPPEATTWTAQDGLTPVAWSLTQRGYCQHCRHAVWRHGVAAPGQDGAMGEPRWEKWEPFGG